MQAATPSSKKSNLCAIVQDLQLDLAVCAHARSRVADLDQGLLPVQCTLIAQADQASLSRCVLPTDFAG